MRIIFSRTREDLIEYNVYMLRRDNPRMPFVRAKAIAGINNLLSDTRNKYVLDEITWDLKENYFEVYKNGVITRVDYSRVYLVECLEKIVFIGVKNGLDTFIPNTAFSNIQEKEEFVSFLNNKTTIC